MKGDLKIRSILGKLVSIENEENWWKPDLFAKNTRHKIPKEINILQEPPDETKNYNCFVYALRLEHSEKLLGLDGWEFTRNLGSVFDEMVENNILQKVATPSDGDMVLYRAKDGSVAHVGIWQGGTVVSKWSWGPLMKHKLYDVPDHYGDDVEFYEGINEAKEFVLSKMI